MRLRRRWPLLLVLLALAGCGWAAWRVHGVGRPIEEAYAKLQEGMTGREVAEVMEPVTKDVWLRLPGISRYDYDQCWRAGNGYRILLNYEDCPPRQDGEERDLWVDDYRVEQKVIARPDWPTRLKLAFRL